MRVTMLQNIEMFCFAPPHPNPLPPEGEGVPGWKLPRIGKWIRDVNKVKLVSMDKKTVSCRVGGETEGFRGNVLGAWGVLPRRII